MTRIRRLTAASGIIWTAVTLAACGGRTDNPTLPTGSAGVGNGGGADATSNPDSTATGTGPQFVTVLEGYAYLGDWAFSKDTLRFSPWPCSPTGGHQRFLVPGFQLDVVPITNGLYAGCISEGSCDPPERDIADPDPRSWDDPERRDIPVLVSQRQAELFCRWTGGRLPSWAELVRAAQGDAELPGVAALTNAAIECYGRGAGDPTVCGQLAQMDATLDDGLHARVPQPKLYRVGAVELDQGPDGHRDLFGVPQRTRTFGSNGSAEKGLCSFADGSPDFVTLDPAATQHVVVQFGAALIRGIKTGLGFAEGGLLDDSRSQYPFGFRCAHDLGK